MKLFLIFIKSKLIKKIILKNIDKLDVAGYQFLLFAYIKVLFI